MIPADSFLPSFQKNSLSEKEIIGKADELAVSLTHIRKEVAQFIFGQDLVIEQVLVSMLSGGHALLVGTPGLGKTYLVETLGTILGLSAKRIQFTPDLMPYDITGSEILDEDETGKRSFRFVKGPLFAQLVMADEINRASPRTQSALLQAMQEHEVSIAGVSYPLPRPFHVLATQNPIEQEGTYPLPEAQLDRFLLQINLTYPDASSERAMALATTSDSLAKPSAVFSATDMQTAQLVVRHLPIGDKVVDGILSLVRAARPETTSLDMIKNALIWGPGPRATQALMLASRARALMDGRLSPSMDDVKALAPAILRHRMSLQFSARAEGLTLDNIIQKLLETLP